jgi:hypothetical protein
VSLGASVVLGAIGFSWWEGLQPWPTTAAHVSVLAAIAVFLVAGALLGRGRQQQPSRQWLAAARSAVVRFWRHPHLFGVGVVAWIVVFGAVVGWDLHSFLIESHNLPTLSYLIGRVTRFAVGRGVLFGIWLAGGAFLVASHRRVGTPRRRTLPAGRTGGE